MQTETIPLKRSVTLPFLVMYGVGTMIGAGFYALLGKVAGEALMYAPIAFLCSGVLALFSSFSFAELSSRYPVSAGEAQYIRSGFNNKSLATVTGWLVILTGIVSAATLTVATIGFLQVNVAIPHTLGIILLVIAMATVAAWGIGQSVAVVTIITIIEVSALIYAASVADTSIGEIADNWQAFIPPADAKVWLGIFSGAFLAFYAFIGFEDMVNMAEEVKNVRSTLPKAIIISVVVTSIFYILVSIIAISAVTPAQLENSKAPIVELVKGQGWTATTGLWIVSLLTGLNGALVQIIMASRVAYGLANSEQAPRWLGKVHPATRTPVLATVFISAIILALALYFPLTTLAKLTSTIILLIFAGVNFSLWRIKKREQISQNFDQGEGPRYPRWVPFVGGSLCLLVLLFQTTILLST
ncbi:MAG: amino acid permease [Gammaproteobacteria bacterium]|nr:amino acid permease [Gammaproteobacteria bacterium]NNC98200.1 amino acid permease [Gammaproteobacteria bacterium]NNM14852.1 amino acid permease [Gammaproteobacteria bacterium]